MTDLNPEMIAVELQPHSAEWSKMAAAESVQLKSILGEVLITVHHIGSTAIPGILAKPIVDLIPIVSRLASLDAKEPEICGLGYRWRGELGLSGRRYCTFDDPITGKRLFQLHCYEQGDAGVLRHLAFRDYLIDSPALAKEYEAQKLHAATLHPNNVLEYNAQKNDWIKKTEREALKWYRARRGSD